MFFHAVVVEVKKNLLLSRLALAMLHLGHRPISGVSWLAPIPYLSNDILGSTSSKKKPFKIWFENRNLLT